MDSLDLDLSADTYDERDLIAEDEYEASFLQTTKRVWLPRVKDLRDSLGPCKKQKAQGACLAIAASAIKEYQETIQRGSPILLSAQYIHNLMAKKTPKGNMQ